MNRRQFLLAGAAATCLDSALQALPPRKTRNLILVTADGLRWQDLFTGIDQLLMNEKDAGMAESAGSTRRERLWRPQPEERRAALMPFFWATLAPRGIVLGNFANGNSVQVTNRYRVSYPGYSELLTGRAQDEAIRGNDPVQNPTPSFFEFLHEQWKLPMEQAAVFASWDMFHYISETRRGQLFINAGYEPLNLPADDTQVRELNKLQMQARFLDDTARHDAFTFALAMAYLQKVQPRLLFIAFDETDDWAHDRRYDRVLDSIQFLDTALSDLWTWIQSSPSYRDSTTLIVTCDHGRGSTKNDWHDHGKDVPAAAQIWVAIIGPDTPAVGEARETGTCYQRDIAPTALELLGVDHTSYPGVLGKPIAAAVTEPRP